MLTLPVPTTLLTITWTIIGFMFGRAFGKRLDQTIKKTEWFKGLGLMGKKLVGASLDFLHHFWIGLLLMVYSNQLIYTVEIYWFGYGLFLDDAPDIPPRFAKLFSYLARD